MTRGLFHFVFVPLRSQAARGGRGWLGRWQHALLGAPRARVAGVIVPEVLLPVDADQPTNPRTLEELSKRIH